MKAEEIKAELINCGFKESNNYVYKTIGEYDFFYTLQHFLDVQGVGQSNENLSIESSNIDRIKALIYALTGTELTTKELI